MKSIVTLEILSEVVASLFQQQSHSFKVGVMPALAKDRQGGGGIGTTNPCLLPARTHSAGSPDPHWLLCCFKLIEFLGDSRL